MVKQKKLEVYFTEEQPDWHTNVFETDFHVIRVRSSTLDKFRESLEKMDRKGNAKYTEEEKHFRRTLWVMRSASPKEAKMNGEEWELSMKSLLKRILDDNWDRKTDGEKEPLGKVSGTEGSENVEAPA